MDKKRQITRKEFLSRSVTGVAGLSLLKNSFNARGPVLRQIGKTGIMVTPICFGAPRTNEISLIKYALDKGINFIDTGRSYGNGNNEKLVGQAVTGIRDKVVIQSKIRLEYNELPSKGKGRKGSDEIRTALMSKLEASLKALNSGYIDILLYHDALEENLLFHEETMKFFSDMKKNGTIKAAGFSTHNDYMHLPERNNREAAYDEMMVPFNPKGSFVHSVTGKYSEWDQERLIKILAEAGEKGIGVIAMKTCSGGKYAISAGNEPDFVQSVEWVVRHKYISSAAIAMANFEQVDEHIRLLNLSA
jgi:aryl-alcohol dehydrogenase-like predicted oxidoreductase